MGKEIIKAWVTKYALTEGIKCVDAEVCASSNGTMIAYSNGIHGNNYVHGEGRNWHRTPESAIARAEEMRDKKIASLRKSIAKMEKLTFKGKSPLAFMG